MTEDRKHQYVVIDIHGMPWGPFDGGRAAALWARAKWPDQNEGDDNGTAGWRVFALHAPGIVSAKGVAND